MIVIHALWPADLGLCLWAEDPLGPPTAPRLRGRPSRIPRPRPHPFACDAGQLGETVDRLAGPAPSGIGNVELDVLLPSSRDAPRASPRLLRDEALEIAPATGVAPWTVPSAALSAQDTLDLLLGLPLGDRSGPRLGDSVWFFAEVAKLALELVARGRVVPALVQQGERWAARWRPAPATAADAARLESLAAAMPAACRAVHEGGAGFAGRPAPAVLQDSLASFVDAWARGALEPRALVPRRGRRTKLPPLHEAWREALASGEPWVKGDPYELELLQEALDEWAYPIGEPSDREFRTCFRLSEPAPAGPRMAEVGSRQAKSPEEADARWRLEILLQGTDEPSFLVPAEDLWATDGPLNAFQRSIEEPHELVLEDLGRALRLYPGLEPALRTPTPTGTDLDAGAAYEFLAGAAASLEQAGFGVLVPPWWGKREAALGLKLSLFYKDEAKVAHKPLVGLDGLCKYRWKAAIGDVELTLAELKRLAQAKWPLVKVRGRWVELRTEDLEAALALFKRSAHKGEMSLGEAMRTGLGLAETPGGLPVVGIDAAGRLKELFAAGGDSRVSVMATPDGFEGELRPYQERGLGWLFFLDRLGLGACLADDMGLGKTPQLLALLVAERKPKAKLGPTLVVCPMSVVGNWQREANRFAPGLDVHVHHGERLKGRAFARAVRGADLVLTTYATATRDKEMLGTVRWERVVVDEAQNIKTSATKQAQAIRSLQSRSRVALTGTPVENRLSELWSIMEFLNPGLLGSAKAFKESFAVPIERYRDEVAEDTLRRVTGPFLLRRLKTDKAIIEDLPDKIEMKVFCNLTREQATLYQAVVDDMLGKVDDSEGMERKGLVLATITKLKQICNHPTHFLKDRSKLDGRSGKLQRLEEILEEVLSEGDRALCFTQFAEMGHLAKAHLQQRFGCETLFLHGGTSKKMRDDMVARFQEDSGPSVFLLSLKAGGTGLNLTAANHVIHFDRWWNPAVEDQATDRAFRIGQARNVQVRKFICAGTLEERIDMMIERKKELAQRIVEAGESWLTELSTAELRDVVTLAADAVAG